MKEKTGNFSKNAKKMIQCYTCKKKDTSQKIF